MHCWTVNSWCWRRYCLSNSSYRWLTRPWPTGTHSVEICAAGIYFNVPCAWEGLATSSPSTSQWWPRRSRRQIAPVGVRCGRHYHRRILRGAGGTSWRLHAHPQQLQHVIPGSRVWSDEWAAYNGLGAAGYVHETVNHAFTTLRQHTNNNEARWAACKATLRRRYSVPETCCHIYLDEYIWRTRRSRTQCFDDILDFIIRRYPV